MGTVVLTKVADGDYVTGNKKVRTRDVALSGTYTVGGETITPTDVGLRKVVEARVHGGVVTVTGGNAGALPVGVQYESGGDVRLLLYQDQVTGAVEPLEQKNAAAHLAGASCRVTIVGY